MQLDMWADLSHVWSYKMNCGCVSQISMRAAQCDRMVPVSVWQLRRTPKAERKTAERKVWSLKGNTESLSSPFLLEQWNKCLGMLGNLANSAQENHIDHQHFGAVPPPLWTPSFCTHSTCAPQLLTRVLFSDELKTLLSSTTLPSENPPALNLITRSFLQLSDPSRAFTSYQDKADMSDNKFLLIAKEWMAAELAHVGDERLGVRFEHTGGLSC